MLPDSMNVGVIAENIRSLQGSVSNLEKAAVRIPKDYSGNETDTGLTWIDGKKIYSKSFEGVTPETTGTFLVGTLGPISTMIHMFGSCSETTHPERLRLLERMYAPAIIIATGEINLSITEGYTSSYYNLTVLYTKPDPVPAQSTKKKTSKKGE